MARRLVAAGVSLVQVNLGNDETWDTHGNAFPHFKNNLFPPTDRAVSALLDDLHSTGELDETLIVMAGEFGRTPQITLLDKHYKLPGRDHWGAVQSVFFAGGGIRGGNVVGKSDAQGAYPGTTGQAREFAATIYQALGIPATAAWHDTQDRPHHIYRGEPIAGLPNNESKMLRRSIAFRMLLLLLIAGQRDAQAEINSVTPRSLSTGTDHSSVTNRKRLERLLGGSLRELLLRSTCTLSPSSRRGQSFDLTLPDEAPLGPLGLWMANSGAPPESLVVVVDDLNAVTDNGDNHFIELAQSISSLCAVDGVCDGSQSDFYRLDVTQGQRLAIEIHTQSLPLGDGCRCRIRDATGDTLHLADDDTIGPDCRFSYRFAAAGEYTLEVHDNRHAAAGSRYHLRVGDFPILSHCYPLAIRRGERASLRFVGQDAAEVNGRELEIPAGFIGDSCAVNVRMDQGKSSAWMSVLASDHAQFSESPVANKTEPRRHEPLSIPIGISGCLDRPSECDSYPIRGVKGQLIRVSSRTRSLACPTLLQMRLFNAAGSKIAETKVSDADQWSFDVTFPEDGEYRLEVSDLLKRGGADFGYWIEVSPAGSFTIALKADAKVRDQFAIEEQHGACAIDLQIHRFGYDGAIDLSFADHVTGLDLLNPHLAAQSAEARVYVVADESWKRDSLQVVRLRATATDDSTLGCVLDSGAFHRLKEPHILFPASWRDGVIVLGGVPPSDPPFAMEPVAPLEFARPCQEHSVALTLKRISKGFKEGVDLLADGLPVGWSVTATAEKDTYTATFTQTATVSAEPDQLSLMSSQSWMVGDASKRSPCPSSGSIRSGSLWKAGTTRCRRQLYRSRGTRPRRKGSTVGRIETLGSSARCQWSTDHRGRVRPVADRV